VFTPELVEGSGRALGKQAAEKISLLRGVPGLEL